MKARTIISCGIIFVLSNAPPSNELHAVQNLPWTNKYFVQRYVPIRIKFAG
jgi:hypothetical protein